jgi:uncharacterized protein (DUF1810 family)
MRLFGKNPADPGASWEPQAADSRLAQTAGAEPGGVFTSDLSAGTETMMGDPYNLQRFTEAQDAGGTYARAVAELRGGRKQSHWMWFVFPQIAGLGQSPASRRFAISSLEEARAYLRHPVLGTRLAECTRILQERPGHDAEQIFGGLDAQKLRSSMTLFLRAAPGEAPFGTILRQYFGGAPDPVTDRLIGTYPACGVRPAGVDAE